jgi:eukaryotic-like serine/threonine-protein kinase
MRISFGPFAFDPQSRLLWRDGAEIALPPRVLAVLEVLIERAGQVVARQDLLDRVWKDAFVTDTSLAEAVSFLRQALGDDPQAPRYIQTVHRRGYRFLLTPTPEESDQGQTGVGPGSDHLRSVAAPAAIDWQLVPWSAAILCTGLAAAAVWHTVTRPQPAAPPVARLELRTAPGTTFDRDRQALAISPDGRSLAWSACEAASGRCAIYVRPIDRLEAQPLSGTDGGRSPVFSPDGRWIAFFADGALKKIAAGGGAPTSLASAPNPGGAAWGADGRIVFAGSAAGGLSVIDGQGGAVQPLTQPAAARGELRHRNPAWVSGRGTGLVFTIATTPDESAPGTLAAIASDTPGVRILRGGVDRAVPADHSYLLLAAGTDLQAATFDERTLVLTGSSDSVAAPVGDAAPQFAVGADALAVVRADARAQYLWNDGVDASALARFSSIAVAPDSTRAAGLDANGDIWIADLAHGATTRLTFGGGNVSPAWAADGSRLYFAARNGAGAFRVLVQPVANRGDATPLPSAPPEAFPTSAAADGRVALTQYKDGHTAVVVVAAAGGAPRVLTDGPFDEGAATFSPDGRWLALESAASGRVEVVVRSMDDGHRLAVSADGGTRPRWSEDGRTIYFESGRRLMKTAFTPVGATTGRNDVVLDRAGEHAIAVAPSGRLLVERRPGPDTAVIVLQWLRELRERLPLPVTAPR